MADPLPAKVPLTLYRGDSRTWQDTFTLDDVPLDLTGYEFLCQIRTGPSLDVVSAVEVEVLDAEAGQIRRALTATEARKLVPPRGVWDLQLIRTSDGFTRTYLAGQVTVIGDVSRA